MKWYVLGEGEERRLLEKKIQQYGLEKTSFAGSQRKPISLLCPDRPHVHCTSYEGKYRHTGSTDAGMYDPVSTAAATGSRSETALTAECELSAEGHSGTESANYSGIRRDAWQLRRGSGKKDLVGESKLERLLGPDHGRIGR